MTILIRLLCLPIQSMIIYYMTIFLSPYHDSIDNILLVQYISGDLLYDNIHHPSLSLCLLICHKTCISISGDLSHEAADQPLV